MSQIDISQQYDNTKIIEIHYNASTQIIFNFLSDFMTNKFYNTVFELSKKYSIKNGLSISDNYKTVFDSYMSTLTINSAEEEDEKNQLFGIFLNHLYESYIKFMNNNILSINDFIIDVNITFLPNNYRNDVYLQNKKNLTTLFYTLIYTFSKKLYGYIMNNLNELILCRSKENTILIRKECINILSIIRHELFIKFQQQDKNLTTQNTNVLDNDLILNSTTYKNLLTKYNNTTEQLNGLKEFIEQSQKKEKTLKTNVIKLLNLIKILSNKNNLYKSKIIEYQNKLKNNVLNNNYENEYNRNQTNNYYNDNRFKKDLHEKNFIIEENYKGGSPTNINSTIDYNTNNANDTDNNNHTFNSTPLHSTNSSVEPIDCNALLKNKSQPIGKIMFKSNNNTEDNNSNKDNKDNINQLHKSNLKSINNTSINTEFYNLDQSNNVLPHPLGSQHIDDMEDELDKTSIDSDDNNNLLPLTDTKTTTSAYKNATSLFDFNMDMNNSHANKKEYNNSHMFFNNDNLTKSIKTKPQGSFEDDQSFNDNNIHTVIDRPSEYNHDTKSQLNDELLSIFSNSSN
jgi:hypothetical protein